MFIERKNKFLIIAYKILDLISTNKKKKELETRVEFCLKLRIIIIITSILLFRYQVYFQNNRKTYK